MEQYIFNEKEDFTFLIIKGNNFPMVHLKGDQYSFPLHNDLTISDRDSNLFFNKMNQSEQMVNVFIVSRRIPKSIIDYVKENVPKNSPILIFIPLNMEIYFRI